MKYFLLLSILSSCIKQLPPCTIMYPLDIKVEGEISYIDLKIGNPAYTYGVYYKSTIDTIDITDRVVGGRCYVVAQCFSADGSYRTVRDTVTIN